jgi:hypothetical protein
MEVWQSGRLRLTVNQVLTARWFESISLHQKVSPTHRMVRATWEDSGAGGSLAESRDG